VRVTALIYSIFEGKTVSGASIENITQQFSLPIFIATALMNNIY
jgi:hypothetical protein